MSTISLTAGRLIPDAFQAARPARSAHRTVPAARATSPIRSRHVAQVADATMRFALALVPFGALAWMFIAH